MTKISTVAIVGGGIAGPVTALALHRAGIQSTIYEAYPSTADGIGGTLALAPNGQAALDLVGAREAVHAVGQPIRKNMFAVRRDRAIELPILPGVVPHQMVNRGDLHRILRDLATRAGIPIEYGKRLATVHERPSTVVAEFTDGTRVNADVLVGADGVHSTVRRLIDRNAPGPKYTGLLGFEASANLTLPEDPDTMVFAFGRQAYYLYWTRPDGTVGWGANLPQEMPMTLTEARAVPATDWLRTLNRAYGADLPGGELLRHSSPDTLQVVGSLHIMPRVPHWHRGRLVLVGDAVHAPSNSSGQGASLAIESAVQLARCLRDLPDVESAFTAYERLRRARVEKVAARAGRINQIKAPGAVARAMLPILMPLLLKSAMKPERTVGPEQRYRIDWDRPVTADPLPAA